MWKFGKKDKTVDFDPFIDIKLLNYDDAYKLLNSFGVPDEQSLNLRKRIIKLARMIYKGDINEALSVEIGINTNEKKEAKPVEHKTDVSLLGKIFKETKTGHVCMLIAYTKNHDTLEDMVSYQRVNSDDTTMWACDYDTFFSDFELIESK